MNDRGNGRGTFQWGNGDVYEGGYKDDERNGRGRMRYAELMSTAGLRMGSGKLASSWIDQLQPL